MKKIIVSADCRGDFDFLFKKVETLHAKNHFDFLLCVGEVLGHGVSSALGQLLNGRISVPLPTYFIEAGEMGSTLGCLYPEGKELVKNFTYLGRAGIKAIAGTKVAYLSGIQPQEQKLYEQVEYSSKYYNRQDVERLVNCSNQNIDILLTNQWPVDSGMNSPNTITHGSQYVSGLVDALCPRYHFSGLENVFFKRKQYRNRKGYATGFVSVGPLNGDYKQKYLYAVQMTPYSELNLNEAEVPKQLDPNPYEQTTIEILKPRLDVTKQRAALISTGTDFKQPPIIFFERFSQDTYESQIQEFIERWGKTKKLEIFFDDKRRRHKGSGIVVFEEVETAKKCLKESEQYSLHGKRIRFSIRDQINQYTDSNCWFCKESQVFDHSLVFHYGKYSYLALDKGPINSNHYLMVPLSHIGSRINLDKGTSQEIGRVLGRLRTRFLQKKQATVYFQRYLNLSHSVNHLIIQCIPIPLQNLQELILKFQKKCVSQRLNFIKIRQSQFNQFVGGEFYYRLQFDDQIYVTIVKGKSFSIDFGRQTLCELLGLEEKINWKACVNESMSRRKMEEFRTLVTELHLQ